jgi:pyrroline-5-carboxylate reductase
MQADNVRMHFRLTVRPYDDPIEVLNHAETITAKRQIICTIAGSTITKIESLLAVKWRASITIRNSHFADTHAIYDASAIVANVV